MKFTKPSLDTLEYAPRSYNEYHWKRSTKGNPIYFGRDFFAVVYSPRHEPDVYLFGIIQRTEEGELPTCRPAFYKDPFWDIDSAKAAAVGAVHAHDVHRQRTINKYLSARDDISS